MALRDAVMSAGGIHPGARPAIERRHRLQWEPVQNGFVLLYPEGMVKLNGSAGEILKRCDGKASIGEITGDLEKAFAATGLEADVLAFIGMAVAKQWVTLL